MSKGNFNNAKTTITLHPPNSTYLSSWSKWSTKVNFPPFLPSQTYSMIRFVLVFASADNLSSLSNFLFLYELTYPSSISLNPSSSVGQHGCQFSSAGALAGREVRSSSRDLPSRERERGGASGGVWCAGCVCGRGRCVVGVHVSSIHTMNRSSLRSRHYTEGVLHVVSPNTWSF